MKNYAVKTTRGTVIMFIVTLVSALIYSLTVRAGLGVLGLFTLASGAAAFGVLLLSSRNMLYFLICPVTCLLSYFISGGSWPAVMMSLSFAAAGALAALMLRKKESKISVTAGTAFCFFVFTAVALIASYLLEGNEFSVAAIKEYIGTTVSNAEAVFTEATDTYRELIKEYYSMGGAAVTDADINELFSDIFMIVKLITPAVAIVLFMAAGYLTASLLKGFLAVGNLEILLPDPRWELYPSSVSAYLFIGAYVLYFISSLFGSIGIPLALGLNLVIILIPAMFMFGIKWIIARIRNPMTRRVGITVIIISGVCFLFYPPASLVGVSLLGSCEVIARHRADKKENQTSAQ